MILGGDRCSTRIALGWTHVPTCGSRPGACGVGPCFALYERWGGPVAALGFVTRGGVFLRALTRGPGLFTRRRAAPMFELLSLGSFGDRAMRARRAWGATCVGEVEVCSWMRKHGRAWSGAS